MDPVKSNIRINLPQPAEGFLFLGEMETSSVTGIISFPVVNVK